MKRKRINSLNIWPGFVDAISTLLLVFIFLLAIFLISQTFLTQAITGKDNALKSLKTRLMILDKDLKINQQEKTKLSELITNLNQQLRNLEIDKSNIEADFEKEKGKANRLQINTVELENKLELLYQELGVEKLNIQTLESERNDIKVENKKLNENIKILNKKLSSLDNSLTLKNDKLKTKEIEVEELSKKLDQALAEKIGELAEYRSEFFGRLKEAIGNQKEINIVGDRFVLQSEIFFKSGAANLGEEGQKKIIEITNILKSISNKIPDSIDWIIQVEGHTDNIPISTKDFPSNWELSVARAIEVAKIMMQYGIQSNRINVAGYGEFKPLFLNNSKSNREKNRRIELKLTQP